MASVVDFPLGTTFQGPGYEQACPCCMMQLTLITGPGWSLCPIDRTPLRDFDLSRALSPTAQRSRGSRHLSRWVHGRAPRIA